MQLSAEQIAAAMVRKVAHAPKGEKRKRERIAVMATCLALAQSVRESRHG